MAELNERLEGKLVGPQLPGRTMRPPQLARPAGPEQTGKGAVAYGEESKQADK